MNKKHREMSDREMSDSHPICSYFFPSPLPAQMQLLEDAQQNVKHKKRGIKAGVCPWCDKISNARGQVGKRSNLFITLSISHVNV
jgi:hypothetical protein